MLFEFGHSGYWASFVPPVQFVRYLPGAQDHIALVVPKPEVDQILSFAGVRAVTSLSQSLFLIGSLTAQIV